MVLAVEPMVNAGRHQVRMGDDGWAIYSQDGSLAAHFEFTIAVTADGPRVLTPWHEADAQALADEARTGSSAAAGRTTGPWPFAIVTCLRAQRTASARRRVRGSASGSGGLKRPPEPRRRSSSRKGS